MVRDDIAPESRKGIIMLQEQGSYFGKPETYGAEINKKGTPQVTIIFRVTHIAGGDAWKPLASTFIRTVRLYLSPAAESYTMKKLEAMGFNGDFGEGMKFSAETMEGVQLQCKHEEYEGNMQEKWDVSISGPTEINRASSDIIRQLNAKYKAKKSQSAPTSKPPAQTEQKPDLTPPPEMKIPETDFLTKKAAWDHWKSSFSGTEAMLIKEWKEAVTKLFPGKSENDMKADDWNKLAQAVDSSIPF
jgi:hypothetical protein